MQLKKFISRGSWWYGLGLILLFSLAAVSTATVIYSVERLIDEGDYEIAKRVSLVGTWLLTMGFMFLAAGLGMWAIRYVSLREGLRRLGSFINAMDYLHDGLVALDGKGRITSANPAARSLACCKCDQRTSVRAAFTCLSERDVRALVDAESPQEIEREVIGEENMRTLRFRSQAPSDVPMVLISDVTERKAREARQREAARLQLIGRISRGVADDFNRILSIISGQTGLLNRYCEGGEAAVQATNEIYRAIQTGSNLATHLLDLSRSDAAEESTDYVEQPVRRAIELLRLTLPPGWTVAEDIRGNLPPVNLSASQIEQTVVNLGLICSDALPYPGTMKVSARVPGKDHLDNVETRYAIVLLISAMHLNENQLLDVPVPEDGFRSISDEAGAVLAVVRSGIEASGGRLDRLQDEHGLRMFRVALPKVRYHGVISKDIEPFPKELRAQLSNKSVLLAVTEKRGDPLQRMAQDANLRVTRVSDTVGLLANIETGSFDAVLLDRVLIEPEAVAVIRAIAKLRPNLRLLVLGTVSRWTAAELPSNVHIFPSTASPRTLFEVVAAPETTPEDNVTPDSSA